MWAVTDNPLKFDEVRKQSKAKKQQQIVKVYTSTQPKTPAPKGSAVSSSYINRQKKLKETQSINKGLTKKLLKVKSTITAFRYVIDYIIIRVLKFHEIYFLEIFHFYEKQKKISIVINLQVNIFKIWFIV